VGHSQPIGNEYDNSTANKEKARVFRQKPVVIGGKNRILEGLQMGRTRESEIRCREGTQSEIDGDYGKEIKSGRH
jgi:hypothetical protein